MKDKFVKIRKGLDIPLAGAATRQVVDYQTDRVAISPLDFKFSTPKLLVSVGDVVRVGSPLFFLEETPDVRIVSPVSGSIAEIRRGEKRRIEQVIIKNDGQFEQSPMSTTADSRHELIETLLQSGLWAFIRQRPFDVVADPRRHPKAIFVNTFDTAPLAPDFAFLLEEDADAFRKGLELVTRLTDGITYLSLRQDADNQCFNVSIDHVQRCYFSGPHPAGDIGVQVHHVAPLNAGEVVWYLNAWQVTAIGKFFIHSKLDFHRRVAVCGAALTHPHYVRLCCGAALTGLAENNEHHSDRFRWVSGNLLTGRRAGNDGFIGFYDHQITVIAEGGEREVLGWLRPSLRKWSWSRTMLSWLLPRRVFTPRTSLHGDCRPLMLPDIYEQVFPFEILPVELFRACQVRDFGLMEELGIYEVSGGDFALCEVVCPSKLGWQVVVEGAIGAMVLGRISQFGK